MSAEVQPTGGDKNCEHRWLLTETGYVRQWDTRLDPETKTVVAYFGGTEDWSEGGDGDDHLACATCGATKPLPDGWEVDYQ